MSKYTQMNAVEEIPAAYVAVPTALADFSKATAHRDRVSGTGMTDVVFGQTRRPRGIPL
jgi:hypothetical protein